MTSTTKHHPPVNRESSSTKDHLIALNDRTTAADASSATSSSRELVSDTEQSNSELLGTSTQLARKPTNISLRDNLQQKINRQKYARYQSYRYEAHDEASNTFQKHPVTRPEGLLDRGRAKTAELLNRKKTLGKADERDAVFDILYENQRGSFFFGIPRYSSNSLLQFDPKPWQNADFRTSAVDIRNAQVPDPSWQWAWKSWYVDMSRDVDEEGWEYSLAFPPQFAWHGNHPWFHSFVRRRRWLRRRVRKDTVLKTKEKAHDLAPDYFTIHSKVLTTSSQRNPLHAYEEHKLEEVELENISALTAYLSKARIDREKLLAIRNYMEHDSDKLHYLADRMPQIMSFFIYQATRRQLLSELIQHHQATSSRKNSLATHDHGNDSLAKQKHEAEADKLQNLSRAIDAAEAQVQKLEYWSDIKGMVQDDQVVMQHSDSRWRQQRWSRSGEKDNFRSKQAADVGAAALNTQPEKQSKDTRNETDSSGYTTAPSLTPSAKQRPQLDSIASDVSVRIDSEDGLERFVTASEGPVSSIKAKQLPGKQFRKSQRNAALQLDGLEEDHDETASTAARHDVLDTVDAEDAIVREE